MKPYKRPDSPSWWVTLRDPATGGRKRVSLNHTGSKARAVQLAREMEDTLRKTATTEREFGKQITLREAVDVYLANLEAHGKVSVKQRRYSAAKLFGYGPRCAGRFAMDPDLPLHDLTPMDVERLVLARLAERNAAQTIHHEVSLLRSATRHAAGLGLRVSETMTKGVVKNAWRLPQVEAKTRYLSWNEFVQVYTYLDPSRPIVYANPKARKGASQVTLTGARHRARQDSQDLLVALTMCGGRWSEVASLTWDRVDFDHDLIRLWGNKDKEERMVPLPPQFRAVLERRLEARHPTSPLVFCLPNGRQRKASSRAVGAAMTACGLNRPDMVAAHGSATVHSLRHTFASWLVQNGADLSEVQDALGHASLQMTKRYAALSKRKTVAKLGGILSQVAAGLSLSPRSTAQSQPGGAGVQPAAP